MVANQGPEFQLKYNDLQHLLLTIWNYALK